MYYKQTENEKITAYIASEEECISDTLIEITEEEYNSAVEELRAKAEAEAQAAEQSKDERIAELEAENAALLYQVLTGEEYADV